MLPAQGVVVIVGASIAGVTAAEELRLAGHTGAIVMIDEQPHHPYSRPPLSKAVLSGDDALESVFFAPMDDLDITFRPGTSAVELVPGDHRVVLADGDSITYDGLVIASGSSPLTMKDLGRNSTGLPELVLRTIDDAALLKERFKTSESVLVIGGGILGMELASAARAAGLATSVLTNEPPLMTMGGPFLSRLIAERAQRAGVRVLYDSEGVELVSRNGQLAASLAGEVYQGDLIVTTVGDRPRVDWLLSSGIADTRGVQVDERCRLSDRIVAAGDITTWGAFRRRHPHWSAAMDQARVAAKALVFGDDAAPYNPRPYFWSDQFGVQLKMAGTTPFAGEPTLLDGDPSNDRAVYQWTSDGTPIGAMTVNFPMPLVRLHRLAGGGAPNLETSRS